MNGIMTKDIYEKMSVQTIEQNQIAKIEEFKSQTTSGKKICVFTKPIQILNVTVNEKIGHPTEVCLSPSDNTEP